jgi:hypothetical protein
VNQGPKKDIVGTWERWLVHTGSGSGSRFMAPPVACGESSCRFVTAAMKPGR